MEMIKVSSSNIAAIGYNTGEAILRIEFLGGGIYDYHSVPHTVYLELLSASSKGQYFDRFIKNGRYSFSKLA